ncbi:MAG: biotin--[acetyl-CoA-carboxylase] ligase [Eubacteriales bacterium]|nr:biotin--[acetyl-CoA-carboxylase] ligase [Eubacteriales bacterium]
MNYQISYFDCLDSTNTYLKELAKKDARQGTVIVARKQTAGRGRMGRSFFSQDGIGIYMSILLRPEFEADKASRLTCLAAVAVARTLKKYSHDVGIKWVNDVFIGDKKVCGILTESATDANGELDYVVVGIGINLCAPSNGFPPQICNIATALFNEKNRAVLEYESIISAILKEFSNLYSRFDEQTFVDEYIQLSILWGKRVNIVQGDSRRPCVVKGIDRECRLLVEYEDGTSDTISHGEAVSIKS